MQAQTQDASSPETIHQARIWFVGCRLVSAALCVCDDLPCYNVDADPPQLPACVCLDPTNMSGRKLIVVQPLAISLLQQLLRVLS